MPEIIHFRGSEKIMKKKKLEKDVATTLQYLEEMLRGTLYKRELTLLALNDCDWREGDLTILDGRGYPGTFVGYYLQKVIYYDFPIWVFAIIYTVFAALVLITWIIWPPRWPRCNYGKER